MRNNKTNKNFILQLMILVMSVLCISCAQAQTPSRYFYLNGVRVNAVDNDSNLSARDSTHIPTQQAVYNFVKNNSSGGGWGLKGNSGTDTTNFIGTTDNNDIIFKRNSQVIGYFQANNVSFGTLSMPYVTTGTLNVAIGNKSLQSNTSGGDNTAIGSNALQLNTTGSGNVGVGNSPFNIISMEW